MENVSRRCWRLNAKKRRLWSGYFLGLATIDAPLGNHRPTAARRDHNVPLARNRRQCDDAVQAEEGNSHSVQIATWKKGRNSTIDVLTR